MPTIKLYAIIIPVFFVLVVVIRSFRVLNEYERGVIFRLGRLVGAKGPGLILLVPLIDKMVKVDMRTVTMDVPPQDVITRDNVTVKVNAVVYFRIIDAPKAIVEVEDYYTATSQISQTTLRNVLGQSDLDDLLSHRETISQKLQQIIDEQTDPWGIKVTTVEVKDVEIPQSLQRAMAKQAEAERERRAKVIHAEGEVQASKQLAEAAKTLSQNKASIQLRYLQTLSEIATEKNSTTIFPIPVDILEGILNKLSK